MANALEQRFRMTVHLDNYPPTPPRQVLSQVIIVLQLIAMAFIFGGDYVKLYLRGMNIELSDEFWKYVSENRMMLIIGIFFFGNTFRNSLLSSGAFEIFYGDDLIFSKLESGRMPGSMEEIFASLEEAMQAN